MKMIQSAVALVGAFISNASIEDLSRIKELAQGHKPEMISEIAVMGLPTFVSYLRDIYRLLHKGEFELLVESFMEDKLGEVAFRRAVRIMANTVIDAKNMKTEPDNDRLLHIMEDPV